METPRLHPEMIEAVKERVEIVDTIAEHVVLRKRGQNYVGLCPFHQEKTPSFTVNPSKQLYYCFGCAAGGNAIKFLMEIRRQSFADVVLELAQHYQIPIQTLEARQQHELQRQLSLREQLYEIVAVAANFFRHALFQPEGEIALDYLRSQRQLSPETLQAFQLGYAPAGWETLYHYLVEQKRYSVSLVEQAGLIARRKKGNGYYDRFRHRLTIPIYDAKGRAIGFGSRTLGDDEPKYLNSPETPLFEKGRTLFALDKARSAIRNQDRAIIVEGYFDAIALHAAGISNTVASLGTAIAREQIQQVLRYTDSKQVILNFDADAAGMQATQRAISEVEALVYSGQVQVRILELPGGKDADEFLRSRADAADVYREKIEQAPLWLDWQISQAIAGKDLARADQFQQVASQMVKLLSRLDDPNQRTYYAGWCSQLLARGDARLSAAYSKNLLAELKSAGRRPQKRNPSSAETAIALPANPESQRLERAEALLLQVYLHCPEYRPEIVQALAQKELEFGFAHHTELWEQARTLEAQPETLKRRQPSGDAAALNPLFARLQDWLNQEPHWDRQLTHLFYLDEKQAKDIQRPLLTARSAIATLELISWEKRKRYCAQKFQELDPQTESQRWQYYYQEYYRAEQRIRELHKERQISLAEIVDSA